MSELSEYYERTSESARSYPEEIHYLKIEIERLKAELAALRSATQADGGHTGIADRIEAAIRSFTYADRPDANNTDLRWITDRYNELSKSLKYVQASHQAIRDFIVMVLESNGAEGEVGAAPPLGGSIDPTVWTCRHCGWSGPTSQLIAVVFAQYDNHTDAICPKCNRLIAVLCNSQLIPVPLADDPSLKQR